MQAALMTRVILSAIGAAGALSLYLLVEGADQGWVGNRTALILAVLLISFFSTVLAMAGRLPLRSALLRAAPLSVLVAALVALAGYRWAEADGFFSSPMPTLAALVVASLPVPLLLAEALDGSWRNYPALFRHSWGIVVRGLVAMVFTGVVWLVIWLSDALLQVVGLTVIGQLIEAEPVPFLITGAAFGLAVAVVTELSAQLSPRLVLWLLRLLTPVVTVVSAIFAGAALISGFDSRFQFLSPALTLLAMAAAGIALVTVTLDEDDAAAAQGAVLRYAARGMAVLVPVLAGLAGWALWIRVSAQGWTPERMFVACLVLLALAYGLIYALAVLRGRNWAGRIRQANTWLALLVIAVAALWLTPVLNAERISANTQAALFLDGRKAPSEFSSWDFKRLGLAGSAALDHMRAEATAAGNDTLLAAMDSTTETVAYEVDIAGLRAELEVMLPVQPASAGGMRTALLSLMQAWELDEIRNACAMRDAAGRPGCVLVVADLLPALPGEEAVLVLDRGGWTSVEGIYPDAGYVMRRAMQSADGQMLSEEESRALVTQWQDAPPPLAPAAINQLGTGSSGLFFVP